VGRKEDISLFHYTEFFCIVEMQLFFVYGQLEELSMEKHAHGNKKQVMNGLATRLRI
jgi:hypothetical protein